MHLGPRARYARLVVGGGSAVPPNVGMTETGSDAAREQ